MLLTVVLLNTKTGKRIIITKVNAYLNNKLGNALQIESLNFSIPNWIELNNVYIKDQAKDTLLYAKHLRIDFNLRSLLGNKWVLNQVLIDGTVLKISQADSTYNFQYIIDAFAAKKTASKKATIAPQINVANLRILELSFRFKDTAQQIYTKINQLSIRNLQYDQDDIKAQYLFLNKSIIDYELVDINQHTIQAEKGNTDANTFKVKIDSIVLLRNQISFNKSAKPYIIGFDPNHINIQQQELLATKLYYTGKESSADIQSFKLLDKTGFLLNNLSLLYRQKDTTFQFQRIKLQSAFSTIIGNIQVDPNQYKVVLNNTILSRKDIQLLAPKQLSQLKPALPEINVLYLDIAAFGNDQKLVIQSLNALANNKLFFLNTSGTINDIANPNTLQFQLKINRLAVQKNILYAFLPPEQQKSIQLPAILNASGNLSGNKQILRPTLFITSEYGNLGLSGSIGDFTNPNQIQYNLVLLAKQLETGKWVRRDSMLGKLNGLVKIKGKGTNYKTMLFNTNMRIESFRFNDVLYNNANILLNTRNGLYNYTTNINNALVNAQIKGTAQLNKEYPSVNALFSIRNANLLAMGFMKDSFVVSTKGLLNLNNLNPDNLDILVKADSLKILAGKRNLQSDSILITGKMDSVQNTVLLLRSAFLDAVMKGKFKYTDLGKIITTQVNQYNGIPTETILSPYIINSSATAKPHAVYAALLPGLFFSKNLSVNSLINSKRNDTSLFASLNIPDITLNGNSLAALNTSIWGIKDSLKLYATADTIKASSILLYSTKLNGAYSKNGFNVLANTADENDKEIVSIGFIGKRVENTFNINLNKDLFFNYENWKVNKDNLLVVNDDGFYAKEIELKNKDQQIIFNSSYATVGSPLTVKINRFDLRNINNFFNKDSLSVAGRLNVDLVADDFNNSIPTINGTASIDSLVYQQVSVGNLKVIANSRDQTGVDFNGTLTGNDNNVIVVGKYNQQNINADIKLGPLQMKSIEPFAKGYLTRSFGTVNGGIQISGSVKSPEWRGSIKMDSVFTVVKNYGTVLKLDKQQIELSYPIIRFPNFTITDSLNHRLIINGVLTHNSGFNFGNNLTVKGNDFIAVDNTNLINDQMYGKAIVDVDTEIGGSTDAPDIAGSIGLKKDSKITFIRQQTAATENDRVGVITFIDMDTVKPWSLPTPEFVPVKKALYANNLNYNLNIDIDKDAEFVLVIDPLTRDELTIKGDAQLNARLNPNGNIDLIGAYNLSRGTYKLNYAFLKKKFELQEGSTILFSGDPQLAETNINAIYEINASPFDLIGTEISGSINNDLYRQKMPFQVVLKIKGQLQEPRLEFNIKLKEKVAGINSQMLTTIENKLLQLRTDASAMNKEVFALLVMGRFIGEQSADFFAGSNNGIKADQIVKESVSRFLSDAVNQIASDLIKGVDIDVNLRTIDDYSTATQRTDLGLSLSKRFIDDRLSISVGKNFTVEGNDPIAKGQNNANVSFLPDASVAYKLSKDGRYVLKTYRRNQYEAILDGYFIETGVAFSLSMDYNKFKELTMKKNKIEKK